MISTLGWIESAGGPLLLAPRSSLQDWSGASPSNTIGSKTDYERACSIADEIGVIAIGKRTAVVLGDEPDRTTILPGDSDADVLMVRWRWADSEEALLSVLEAIGSLSFVPVADFQTSNEEYVLFDSACGGGHIDRYLSVTLAGGRYSIESATFEPDDSTFALVHRLSSLRVSPIA